MHESGSSSSTEVDQLAAPINEIPKEQNNGSGSSAEPDAAPVSPSDQLPSASPTTAVTPEASAPPKMEKRLTEGPALVHLPTGIDPASMTHQKRPWRRHITPFERIAAATYAGKGTKDTPYVVTWLDEDSENPQTYSQLEKWSLLVLVAMSTFAVALGSSLYSGGIASLAHKFHSSTEVLILGLSLYVLGFAVGPLFWAPASEVFGRRPVMILSYFFFTIWNGVAAASPNMGAMIVFRFLAGAFGSSPLTNAGGAIADMFNSEQRAIATAIFASMPFMGPAVGPIIGGFMSTIDNGWRWIQLLICGFSALITVICFLFMPETYPPTLLRKRAQALSEATGLVFRAPQDAKKELDVKELLSVSLSRPWALLFREPIVFIITLYMSAIYGTLYMFFGAFPIVFEEGRGWSAGVAGLPFLSVLVGMLFGVAQIILHDNRRYVKLSRKLGRQPPPESRLPPAVFGGVGLVIGLAMFAGTCQPSVHWIVPVIAASGFGYGMMLVFISLSNYLIDSYLIYAASVLAANSVMRSLAGAAFPLFTTQMYHGLGVNKASAIPAALAAALLPAPLLFIKYGETIRKKCPYAKQAAAIFEQMSRPKAPPAAAAAQTSEKTEVKQDA